MATHTITIGSDGTPTPSPLTVNQNDTVVFENSLNNSCTVTSPQALFNSSSFEVDGCSHCDETIGNDASGSYSYTVTENNDSDIQLAGPSGSEGEIIVND